MLLEVAAPFWSHPNDKARRWGPRDGRVDLASFLRLRYFLNCHNAAPDGIKKAIGHCSCC